MKRPSMTIARWMGVTAVLAVNAALVRAFVVQEMFCGGILIFVALQVGLWCLLRSQGRVRRFWMGFEVFGVASVLAMFSCEIIPTSALAGVVISYTDLAIDFATSQLPTLLVDQLDEHWQLFLAIVYFVPELLVALLGGAIATWMIRRSQTDERIAVQESPPPLASSSS